MGIGIIDGLILGFIQGVTEFLPISSTGHLILAREFLGIQNDFAGFGLAVDAVLHFATAFAVLVYFRKDITELVRSTLLWLGGREPKAESKTLILALALGTIPAVILGLLLEGYMETAFRSAELVAYALIGGSALFLIAEYFAKQNQELSVKKGIGIGFFQALALIPGVSRSGAAISGGLLLGLTREGAARFAFLLSFPIILGAGMKKFLELGNEGVLIGIAPMLVVSSLAAFISGMLAIHFMLRYLRTHTLGIFIIYRLALAALILGYGVFV